MNVAWNRVAWPRLTYIKFSAMSSCAKSTKILSWSQDGKCCDIRKRHSDDTVLVSNVIWFYLHIV